MKAVTLSETDRKILYSYKDTLEGWADFLGSGFEIVLHSLENLERSVICIFNGEHTGRKEGAPITNLALNMLETINNSDQPSHVTYFTENNKGEPMKSITIAIRGEKGNAIGLICINLYLNTPMNTFLESFFQAEIQQKSAEIYPESPTELIEKVLFEIQQKVMDDTEISSSVKNKEIIYQLYDKGVFEMKDAVEIVSHHLNLSINTVYMHVRNKKKAENN